MEVDSEFFDVGGGDPDRVLFPVDGGLEFDAVDEMEEGSIDANLGG